MTKRQIASAAFFAGYTAKEGRKDLWQALAAFQKCLPKKGRKILSERAAT